MADATVQNALANEARRNELKIQIAGLKAWMDSTATISDKLTTLNADTARRLQSAQAELATLEQGAGPGITDDYGQKSNITQLLEAERAAAKSAAIDYVIAHPECSEADAVGAWDSAAVAFHTEIALPLPMQSGLALGLIYRKNLFDSGRIQSNAWEAHRAWILATPKDIIMGL